MPEKDCEPLGNILHNYWGILSTISGESSPNLRQYSPEYVGERFLTGRKCSKPLMENFTQHFWGKFLNLWEIFHTIIGKFPQKYLEKVQQL